MPEQSALNHARIDPWFHYFLLPVCLLTILLTLWVNAHDWPNLSLTHVWSIVVAFAFAVTALKTRTSALRAQDRVILLEESLRASRLMTAEQLGKAKALTVPQIIALRFASDAEFPALSMQAVEASLTGKQIKAAIKHWRADLYRV